MTVLAWMAIAEVGNAGVGLLVWWGPVSIFYERTSPKGAYASPMTTTSRVLALNGAHTGPWFGLVFVAALLVIIIGVVLFIRRSARRNRAATADLAADEERRGGPTSPD